MRKFQFTGNDLIWYFNYGELENLERLEKNNFNKLIVKRICDTQQLDFNKCSNIRIINQDLYAPKIAFDYNE